MGIKLDDYLFETEEEENERFLTSPFMIYTRAVTTLTISLVVLNSILSFIILTMTTIEKDRYAYILALLSLCYPVLLVINAFIIFIFFDWSYYMILIAFSMIGMFFLSIASISVGILYLLPNTDNLFLYIISTSIVFFNFIILSVLIGYPAYYLPSMFMTKYNYETVYVFGPDTEYSELKNTE